MNSKTREKLIKSFYKKVGFPVCKIKPTAVSQWMFKYVEGIFMYCVYNNTQLHLMIFHELFLRDVIADNRKRQETREVYDLHQGSYLHRSFYFR